MSVQIEVDKSYNTIGKPMKSSNTKSDAKDEHLDTDRSGTTEDFLKKAYADKSRSPLETIKEMNQEMSSPSYMTKRDSYGLSNIALQDVKVEESVMKASSETFHSGKINKSTKTGKQVGDAASKNNLRQESQTDDQGPQMTRTTNKQVNSMAAKQKHQNKLSPNQSTKLSKGNNREQIKTTTDRNEITADVDLNSNEEEDNRRQSNKRSSLKNTLDRIVSDEFDNIKDAEMAIKQQEIDDNFNLESNNDVGNDVIKKARTTQNNNKFDKLNRKSGPLARESINKKASKLSKTGYKATKEENTSNSSDGITGNIRVLNKNPSVSAMAKLNKDIEMESRKASQVIDNRKGSSVGKSRGSKSESRESVHSRRSIYGQDNKNKEWKNIKHGIKIPIDLFSDPKKKDHIIFSGVLFKYIKFVKEKEAVQSYAERFCVLYRDRLEFPFK